MYEWIQSLLNDPGFLPHGHSFLWTENLLWLHVSANLLIVIACYAIPVMVWRFMRQRKDLRYSWVLTAFAIFIFACGTTHLVVLWNIWNHAYWLEGLVTLFTGIVSILTLILIWRLMPGALNLPSREQLQYAYHQLEQTHQALLDKDSSYQLLTESLAEGLWIFDTRGITTSVNPRMAEMLGYTQAEMLGRKVYDFMTEDQIPLARELIKRHLQGISERHEFTFQHRDGHRVYTLVSATALRNKRGKITGAMGLITDITEREIIAQELTRLTARQDLLIKERTQTIENREQKLRAIIHANIDAIITINSQGSITSVNPAAENMFGYNRNQMIGQNVNMLMPQPYAHQHDQYLTKYLHGGKPGIIGKRRELEGKRADGEIFPLELAISEVKTSQEHFFVGMLRDISERKRAQEAIEELNSELLLSNNSLYNEIAERKKAEEEARSINARLQTFITDLQSYTEDIHKLNEMSDFLQACNNLHEITEVIRTFAQRFFNTQAGALYLLKGDELQLFEHPWGQNYQAKPAFPLADCWAMRNSKIHPSNLAQQNLICQHFHAQDLIDHTCIPLYARARQVGLLVLYGHSPLWSEDNARNANRSQLLQAFADHLAGAISNQTLRNLLQEQSTRDPLTGLHNRRFLNEQLHLEINRCQRENKAFGLLLMDIDHFKAINDGHGHDVGDQVLVRVAHSLFAAIRGSDILCRYGGEEFIVLLPDTNQQQALVIAEKLRRRIAGMEDDWHLGKAVTLSVGVAAYPQQGQDAEALLKAADQALYQAKHQGRNRSVLAP